MLLIDPSCSCCCPDDFPANLPANPDIPSIPFPVTGTCTLWGSSSYADLAITDCAVSDGISYSYADLLILKNSL